MKNSYILLIFTLLSGCYLSEPLPPDQEVWDYAMPWEEGLDSAFLNSLNYILETEQYEEFQNVNSLLLIRNNHIVFENYFSRIVWRPEVALGRSTGLLAVMAIGRLQEEGLLHLDSPIYKFSDNQYLDIFNTNPLMKMITIKDLLTHRSGLSWNETILPLSNLENDLNKIKNTSDWIEYVLTKPLEATPGTRYNYNSANFQLLSMIIENSSGEKGSELIKKNFFVPMKISQYFWENDPTGKTNMMDGLQMSLLDFAKIGKLHLDEGNWMSNQLIGSEWVTTSTSQQVQVSDLYHFGYGWWRFGDNFNTLFPINDVFYFPAENGNHMYVLPHKNMIIMIGASNKISGFYNPSLRVFLNISANLPSF